MRHECFSHPGNRRGRIHWQSRRPAAAAAKGGAPANGWPSRAAGRADTLPTMFLAFCIAGDPKRGLNVVTTKRSLYVAKGNLSAILIIISISLISTASYAESRFAVSMNKRPGFPWAVQHGERPTTPTTYAIVFVRPQPASDGNADSNIWIMNSDGSNQTQLTSFTGEDRWPALSPDGSKVAYVSRRSGQLTLWVMNSDGTNPTQLPVSGNTQAPTWSPDGSQIAYANDSQDFWEVWVVNADGTNPRRLTTHAGAAGLASWSTNGQKLVYGVEPSAGYFDLYTINIDSSGQALLLSSSAGSSNHFPAWSPDGTQIATIRWPAGISSSRDLWLMNADGSNGSTLVNDVERNFQHIGWSLDNNWLVFSKSGQIWRVQQDGTQLFPITANGGWEPSTNASDFAPISRIFIPLAARDYCSGPFYTDNFSNPGSGWPINDVGSVRWEYLNGEYRILVRNISWEAGARANLQVSDHILAADVRNATGVYGTYGLIIGLSDDWSQFYLFEIDPGGYYAIWRYDAGSWTVLASGLSGNINTGVASNRLKIERNGTSIKAYANNQLLATVSDSTHTGPRRVGLMVFSYDQPNVDIRFDNFSVYNVNCGTSALSEVGRSSNGALATVDQPADNQITVHGPRH